MKLLSQFKETLAQDGYADMYVLMKQFIKSGYDGPIFCDHSHRSVNAELLGSKTNMATSSAFIQGLIYAARSELGKEMAAQLAKVSNSTSVSINEELSFFPTDSCHLTSEFPIILPKPLRFF